MRILVAAFACEPGKGSEPAVGWGWVTSLAEAGHDVVAITRANNRDPIEAELAVRPRARLAFVYHDLPDWLLRLKKATGGFGLRAYYLLWCRSIRSRARQIVAESRIDLCHHVTFAHCWSPSPLANLGPPLIWGPVGGAEPCSSAFWPDLGWRGAVYEAIRTTLRGVAAFNPMLRRSARTVPMAVASTPETARWLARIGCRTVWVASQVGLDTAIAGRLAALARPAPDAQTEWRLLIIGDLLPHKGVHLALAALRNLPGRWSLDIVGDGPERRRLERMARTLTGHVRFHGHLPRDRALERMQPAHLLLVSALHDSGGFTVVEALAAGVPVLSLDRGGPPLLAGDGGIAVPAPNPGVAVAGIRAALTRLFSDPAAWPELSAAARRRAAAFLWPEAIGRVYAPIAAMKAVP
ncbi:MAG: glycosyltransferase [Alphaproteobacteria bacterium]